MADHFANQDKLSRVRHSLVPGCGRRLPREKIRNDQQELNIIVSCEASNVDGWVTIGNGTEMN